MSCNLTKTVKIFLNDIRLKVRLFRILRAVKFELTPEQRMTILNPNRPDIYGERRSGKTMTACLWVLLHRKETMAYCSPVEEIPDPDIIINRQIERLTYENLRDMAKLCRKHGISVCNIPFREKFPYWKYEIIEKSKHFRYINNIE